MTDLTGKNLGDYCVLRRLGSGGMAEVYLASQESLGRQVALKVLQPALASDGSYVQRFMNEARAAASLVHGNIVQIYEVGQIAEGDASGGVHFIAQEYVPGKNLAEVLQRQGALPPRLVLDILRQVAAALHKAAEQGIVHRDIKPENLLLNNSGEVKVADFGLARVRDAANQSLTQAGVAMGTPLYMSPEQIESRPVDLRSDLYSLGVTAYHLLAGQPPHTGETALAIAVQHLNVAPKSLAEVRDDLPHGLVQVVERLMAKLPEERYASPGELLADLRELATIAQVEGWGEGPENWPLGDRNMAEWITGPTGTAIPIEHAATRKLNTAMKTLAMLQPAKNSRRRKVAFMVAALVAGFFLSIVTRPRNYLREREPSSVVKRETAWAQIYQANLAPSEEAWLAVAENFPAADPYEKLLADQGLVRYYLLLDENNKKALAKLRELDARTQTAETHLSTKAFIKAALVVTESRLGNEADARRELGKITPEMSQKLRESDRRLYELLQTTRGALGE